ncbi:MAG: flagellin, partial [Alphaproteobacteria bacterium]|nr:flagellin [Alphaproteobacteria bacterium]
MERISLSASMRSNLLSMKNTSKVFDATQLKLSTGYKVNSAMDNPNNFFTAVNLSHRADDLSTLLDGIGQAVSTLRVTDNSLTTLDELIQQAGTIANNAYDSPNISARATSIAKYKDNKTEPLSNTFGHE